MPIGLWGLFQPFSLQKMSCTSDQSGREKFMLKHAYGIDTYGSCSLPSLLIDGTLSSDPRYLNFLKQSLLGCGDVNVACWVGGVSPLSWWREGELGLNWWRTLGKTLFPPLQDDSLEHPLSMFLLLRFPACPVGARHFFLGTQPEQQS